MLAPNPAQGLGRAWGWTVCTGWASGTCPSPAAGAGSHVRNETGSWDSPSKIQGLLLEKGAGEPSHQRPSRLVRGWVPWQPLGHRWGFLAAPRVPPLPLIFSPTVMVM